MTYEFRSNGRTEIELTAETEIEKAFMDAMLNGAIKGKQVKLEPGQESGPPAMVLSMEK